MTGTYIIAAVGVLSLLSFSQVALLLSNNYHRERITLQDEQHAPIISRGPPTTPDTAADSDPSSTDAANGDAGETRVRIDRIFYVNPYGRERRKKMEKWLSQQSRPYRRIKTIDPGDNATCTKDMKKMCKLLVTKAYTHLAILEEHRNASAGTTLVLEDDVTVLNMSLLEQSLKQVPPDWDIVRWGCSGFVPPEFEWVKDGVFRTACINETTGEDGDCTYGFCGGNSAYVLRDGSRLERLRDVWSKQPHNTNMDCRLTTSKVKSYCINNLSRGGIGKDPQFSVEKDTRLALMKFDEPTLVHSNPSKQKDDRAVVVDVLSIGSETRPEYVSSKYRIHYVVSIRKLNLIMPLR